MLLFTYRVTKFIKFIIIVYLNKSIPALNSQLYPPLHTETMDVSEYEYIEENVWLVNGGLIIIVSVILFAVLVVKLFYRKRATTTPKTLVTGYPVSNKVAPRYVEPVTSCYPDSTSSDSGTDSETVPYETFARATNRTDTVVVPCIDDGRVAMLEKYPSESELSRHQNSDVVGSTTRSQYPVNSNEFNFLNRSPKTSEEDAEVTLDTTLHPTVTSTSNPTVTSTLNPTVSSTSNYTVTSTSTSVSSHTLNPTLTSQPTSTVTVISTTTSKLAIQPEEVSISPESKPRRKTLVGIIKRAIFSKKSRISPTKDTRSKPEITVDVSAGVDKFCVSTLAPPRLGHVVDISSNEDQALNEVRVDEGGAGEGYIVPIEASTPVVETSTGGEPAELPTTGRGVSRYPEVKGEFKIKLANFEYTLIDIEDCDDDEGGDNRLMM